MSETKSTTQQSSSLLAEAGPIGVWIVVYNIARRLYDDQAIYIGTGAFMVAVTAALIYSWHKQKRVPPMLVFSTIIVLGFGAMGIFLQDPIFIYMKPTIINVFYAVLILGGLALGHNIWRVFFKHIFTLPDNVWKTLAIRWSVFFLFLALLNEFMWRHITDSVVPDSARWFEWLTLTESFWANAKLGVMALSVIFAAAQLPLLLKYMPESEGDSDGDSEN